MSNDNSLLQYNVLWTGGHPASCVSSLPQLVFCVLYDSSSPALTQLACRRSSSSHRDRVCLVQRECCPARLLQLLVAIARSAARTCPSKQADDERPGHSLTWPPDDAQNPRAQHPTVAVAYACMTRGRSFVRGTGHDPPIVAHGPVRTHWAEEPRQIAREGFESPRLEGPRGMGMGGICVCVWHWQRALPAERRLRVAVARGFLCLSGRRSR